MNTKYIKEDKIKKKTINFLEKKNGKVHIQNTQREFKIPRRSSNSVSVIKSN